METERLDVWLHKVLIIKRRVSAKELADKGRILVNGNIAKPSSLVRAGSEITIVSSDATNRHIRVIGIPRGNVSRERAEEFYQVL